LCWGAGPLAKGHRDHAVPFSFFRQTSARRGKTSVRIDLNADVGEAAIGPALDAELSLIPHLTSVNVACGGHAGDADTMARTILVALNSGVSVGAHPGYADREFSGRRNLALSSDAVRGLVTAQIAMLVAVAESFGCAITHVKPHGALYNQAARDNALADAIAEAVVEASPTLCLVGLAGSALVDAGRRSGLTVAAEAFVDRAYQPDGSLVRRDQPGALIGRPEAAVAQALALVRDREVIAIDGTRVAIDADTLCLHGDTPGALAIARDVRSALEAAGVEVVSFHASRLL
jgi:UPF0271 protein